MEIFITAVYLFLLSLIFAFLEIEVEGKFGWAAKLPTWKKKSGPMYFLFKKPLTGYHQFVLVLLLLFFHFPLLFINWSWSLEALLLSFFILFSTVEDFLWFVFNPAFGIKKFKKKYIWWHANSYWVFGLFPIDYLAALILFLVLSSIGGNLLFTVGVLLINILLMILSIPFVGFYKKRYVYLRK